MTVADSSALRIWEWVENIGWAFVIFGCIGEGLAEFTKFPKEEHKRHNVGKFSWLILVAGLALEFLGSGRVAAIKDLEVARLNREAGEANEHAAKLEKEAAETRVRAAKLEAQIDGLNPLKKPVVSLSAFVKIGFSNAITSNKMTSPRIGGDTEVTRAELFFWSVRTHGRFRTGPPTVKLTTDKVMASSGSDVFLTFSTPHVFELLDWPRTETAGELLDKLDSVEIQPFFIAGDTINCQGGFVVLTINSLLTRRFEIPEQQTSMFGPIFGTDTNTAVYDPKNRRLMWPNKP